MPWFGPTTFRGAHCAALWTINHYFGGSLVLVQLPRKRIRGSDMSIIEAHAIGKSYRIPEVDGSAIRRLPWHKGPQHWALQNVSFKVSPGEVVAILGKNGSGKSTLFKVLSSITPPTTGSFKAEGRIGTLLEASCGFHGELTGRQNIYLSGAILGMHRWEIKEKMADIIEFSQLGEAINWEAKRYSSGMTVRLGFSVAAHLQTEILLIDEALAVGDYEFQERCINKLRGLAQAGKTVLFVSHDLKCVRDLCSRGIVLQKGEVQFDGPIEQALTNYHE